MSQTRLQRSMHYARRALDKLEGPNPDLLLDDVQALRNVLEYAEQADRSHYRRVVEMLLAKFNRAKLSDVFLGTPVALILWVMAMKALLWLVGADTGQP